jgi:ABC-2 type transport system ATP-binding protein
MKGELWEVRCSQRMKVRELLQPMPGVRSVGIFGNKIHALLDDGLETRLALEVRLRDAGFVIDSLKRIPPTLEDVFIATITAKDGG